MARRARRERITEAFDVFHATVAEVFGAADRLTDAAARAHAEAMAEMWLRETGLDDARVDPRLTALFANPSLAHVVARVAADREAAFEAWSQDADGSGPERLTGIVADAAFGSAGDGDDWLAVGKADLDAPVPQLWRIGTGTVGPTGPEFPVAVPLLDTAHLEVVGPTRTRPAAESLVESLLMRVVCHFRPGLVQLHVWDVGRLTGSLPGLYPLTRSGLLTVHDPGDLGGPLTGLSDPIRRAPTPA